MRAVFVDAEWELQRRQRLGIDKKDEVWDGRSDVLGVTFSTVEGPKLRIAWDGGSADV